MSRETPNVPMTTPCGSRRGSFVVATQVSEPSAQVSRSSTSMSGRPVTDDLLLVVERLLRVLGVEEVEIALAKRVFGVREPDPFAQRSADLGEAALAILEVHVVGRRLQEGVQEMRLSRCSSKVRAGTGGVFGPQSHVRIFGGRRAERDPQSGGIAATRNGRARTGHRAKRVALI